jgi:hypothetical protein
VIRYILQRRWLPWHLLWWVAVAGCVWLGMWQLQAAMAPQPAGADTQVWRNYAYALNWLVFAVVALWFWWRFMRDQRAAELTAAEQAAEQASEPEKPSAPNAASAAGATVALPETRPAVPSAQQRFDPFATAEPHQGESAKSGGGSV